MQLLLYQTRIILVAVSVLSPIASAAPATAQADDGSVAAGTTASADRRQGEAGLEGTAISSGNGTMDRLLNAADNPSAPERPRKTLVEGTLPAKFTGSTAASSPSPLADLRSAIMGNREADPKKEASDPTANLPQTRRHDGGQTAAGPRAVSQDSAPGLSPSERTGFAVTVARYVRENRMLVIGVSLVVLAMIWGAATFASQRRRS